MGKELLKGERKSQEEILNSLNELSGFRSLSQSQKKIILSSLDGSSNKMDNLVCHDVVSFFEKADSFDGNSKETSDTWSFPSLEESSEVSLEVMEKNIEKEGFPCSGFIVDSKSEVFFPHHSFVALGRNASGEIMCWSKIGRLPCDIVTLKSIFDKYDKYSPGFRFSARKI